METDGHGKSYGEWKHEKEGAPTLRGMVKADVEMAMASADSFAGFIAELQKMGYEVKYGPQVAHITVRHKDAKKNVRLDRLDAHYSEAALREYFEKLRELPPEWRREYKQQTSPKPPRWRPKAAYKPMQRRARYRGHVPVKCGKITGFMACYYHYCALLRKSYRGKVSRRSYHLLREDFIKFNRYRQQCDLIWEQKITTVNELLTYKERLQTAYGDLTAQRKALYRAKNIPYSPERLEQIQALTARIRALRREIGICVPRSKPTARA